MGLLDNFGTGWLGQLINAGGGYDNPGWAFLRQLAVGPPGGPIDRSLSGQSGAQSFDESGFLPQASQQPQAQVAPPPQPIPAPAPDVQGPDSWGRYGGINYPIYGQPEPAQDLSARAQQAPVQAAPQPPPQQTGPDFLQRLQAGAGNFTSSDSPITGLINSIAGLATGQRTDKAGIVLQNQKQAALAAFQLLRAQGVPEQQAFGYAQLIAQNPEIAKELFKPPTTAEGAAVHPFYNRNAGGQGGVGDVQLRKAEAEATGKNLAEYRTKINEGVRSSISMRNTLDRMSKLSAEAYEGAGAPALQYARSILTTYFGIPQGTVRAGEEFTALANRLTLDAAGGKLGAQFSNVDLAFMKAQFPNLAQTREGRMQLINYLRAMADRNAQVGKLAEQYEKQSGGTLKGFDNWLAQWSEAHPLFPGGQLPGGVSGGLNWKVVTPQ